MADVYYSLYPHGLPTDTVRLLDGTHIHYRTSEAGQIPVILVHGYSLSSVIWEKSQILMPSRYRSFAPDIRGFGLSDKPVGGYTFDELADDLAQFLRSLKIRHAVFVGHALGGNILQHFAVRYPDRVMALVLVNTTANHQPHPGNISEVRQRIDGYGTKIANGELLQTMVPRYFDAANVTTEDLAHFVEVGLMASTEALKQALETLYTAPLIPNEKYAALTMPTLIIVGAHDPFGAYDQAVALSDVISKSKIVVMARCGHSPMWEKPIEFVKAVTQFLEENGLK